jgi:hypothetical protein
MRFLGGNGKKKNGVINKVNGFRDFDAQGRGVHCLMREMAAG